MKTKNFNFRTSQVVKDNVKLAALLKNKPQSDWLHEAINEKLIKDGVLTTKRK